MARIHILKGFSDLEGALWVLKNHPGLPARSDIVGAILESGRSVTDKKRFEILQLLEEWGIADNKKKSLTPKGEDFYALWQSNWNVAIDVLHGLQYSLWTRHAPSQNFASYAYQNVCSYLWEYRALPRTQDLITYIYNQREHLDHSESSIANAFSSKSVNGAYDWLLPLSPPVLEGISESAMGRRNYKGARFARRRYCSPALFLMGLSWGVMEMGNGFGDLVGFEEEHRTQICRFCLIDELQFDFMFNQTLRRFSQLLKVRRSSGLYIVIERDPKINDFY